MSYAGWNGFRMVDESELPSPADIAWDRLVDAHEDGFCPLESSGHSCDYCDEKEEEDRALANRPYSRGQNPTQQGPFQ